jgi:hypothetical protein
MFASLAFDVGFFGHFLQVSPALFNQSKILVLDHGVRLGAHVISNGHPICAEVCNILVKVLQLRD